MLLKAALIGAALANGAIWGVNNNDNIYYKPTAEANWQHIPGGLKRIDVGELGVFGVNKNDDIYYRVGTHNDPSSAGASWQHLPGKLKWIASGATTVWGVNSNDDIFYASDIKFDETDKIKFKWNKVDGRLKDVTFLQRQGENGLTKAAIWGVNNVDQIYCRSGLNDTWRNVPGRLKQIDIGPFGVFGVSQNDDIFYRVETHKDPFSLGTTWQRIEGKLKWISASNGTVWGVNSNDDIFYASDISFDGKDQVHLKWNKVDGKLKQVSVFWKPLLDDHDCSPIEDCRLTQSQLICDSAGLLEAHVSFAELQGQVANFTDLVVGGIVADRSCRGSVDPVNQRVSFAFDPEECGVEIKSNDTHIFYEAVIKENQPGVISRDPVVFEIDLECTFARTVEVVLHDYFTPVQGHQICTMDDASGAFEVEMNLFTDQNMENPIGEGHTVTVPDPLFVQLEILETIDQFVLKMENCWATPTPDSDFSYNMIQNYQGNPGEVETGLFGVTENCNSQFGTFWFDSFVFPGYDEVYLHCRVNICDQSTQDCSCDNEQRRRRRSAPEENIVTLGPISVQN